MRNIFTTCKRSLRRLCFHRCLSVHRGGLNLCSRGVSILGVSLSREDLRPGGLCPGGSLSGEGLCPGGLCPEGSLSRGSLSGEFSVQGGLCHGDPLPIQ